MLSTSRQSVLPSSAFDSSAATMVFKQAKGGALVSVGSLGETAAEILCPVLVPTL